jgi:hypothetical protein
MILPRLNFCWLIIEQVLDHYYLIACVEILYPLNDVKME